MIQPQFQPAPHYSSAGTALALWTPWSELWCYLSDVFSAYVHRLSSGPSARGRANMDRSGGKTGEKASVSARVIRACGYLSNNRA